MARTKTPDTSDVSLETLLDDIVFVGKAQEVRRILTGMWSLDRACAGYKGELGFPVTSVELFGPTSSGKSSLSYSIAGTLCAQQKRQLALADLEGFNPQSFKDILRGAGYRGQVHIIGGKNSDEVLDNFLETMELPEVAAGILDSVAAISPMAELNSSSGEANMGRRAKTMSAHLRKLMNQFRKEEKLAIYTNHVLPNLGFVGTTTPGGNALHYLCAVRIYMKSEKIFSDGSFVIEGTVKKNRWGYRERKFHAFFLIGHGLHPGMSAIWDCFKQKILVQKKGDKFLRWKDSNETIPSMTTFAKYAKAGETEPFAPFFTALKDLQPLEEGEPEGEDETES